jgi:hypothetical protein
LPTFLLEIRLLITFGLKTLILRALEGQDAASIFMILQKERPDLHVPTDARTVSKVIGKSGP